MACVAVRILDSLILLMIFMIPKAVSQDNATNNITACENSWLSLNCSGVLYDSRIEVLSANYGRLDSEACAEDKTNDKIKNTNCNHTETSTALVKANCQHNTGNCTIWANNSEFGDPCPSTPKYLTVTFRCIPMSTIDKYNLCIARCSLKEDPAAEQRKCFALGMSLLSPLMDGLKKNFSIALAVEVMEMVETLSQSTDLQSGDLSLMTKVMVEALNLTKNRNINSDSADNVNMLVLNFTSNLLSNKSRDAWKGLPRANQTVTATRLLTAVEEGNALLANSINRTQRIPKNVPGLAVQVDVVNVSAERESETLTFTSSTNDPVSSSAQFSISHLNLKDRADDGLGRVTFALYDNIGEYLPAEKAEDQAGSLETSESPADNDSDKSGIMTKVISASLVSKATTGLKKPVQYTLDHIGDFDRRTSGLQVGSPSDSNKTNKTCVFWNFERENFKGHWSTKGCRVVSTNSTQTTCECDHLTNFAVLMSIVKVEGSRDHDLPLSIITYIGCTISIVCLALAFITFCWFRNLQCDRNTIHKNLVLCLMISEIIFVFGIIQHDNTKLCAVVAGFLHYFFLASFAWMCLEGVQLYVLLIEVFEAEKSRVKWYYLGGYGVPAIIVTVSTITAAVKGGGYGTENYCWLSTEGGYIWAFVGPAIVIIAVNTVMLGVAIYMMCKHTSTAASWKMEKSKLNTMASWLRGAAILVVLLGTTWIFGLFSLNREMIFMSYIFTILNSLQGLFIFIFHCLANEKVQKEYRKCIQRSTCLPEGFRTRYGGLSGSAALSTGQNPSTSSGVPIFLRLFANKKKDQNLSGSSFQNSHSSCDSKTKKVRVVISPPGEETSSRKVKRHESSTSDSARLTDSSGFGSHEYDQYLEENIEDASGYLEPSMTHVDENEFNLPDICETSALEGSVIFMDYERLQDHKDSANPPGKIR